METIICHLNYNRKLQIRNNDINYNKCYRDENGEWRRLDNEELNSFYRSSNIVRVIKSRRLDKPDT